MTKANREPSRWRGKVLIALFVTAVLSMGSVQVLAPVPAAAYLTEDDGCEGIVCEGSDGGDSPPTGDGTATGGDNQGGSWDDGTAWESGSSDSGNGDGVGADNGFGQDLQPTDGDSETGTWGGDLDPYNPNNPHRPLQAYDDPPWATDSRPGYDWQLGKLQHAYGHCESIQEDIADIRHKIDRGKWAGRWYTLQTEKSRLAANAKAWKRWDCAELYDQVGR